MTVIAAPSVETRRVPGTRIRQALAATWGGVIGIAPHVLHHVGPLAGAAILAGTGGRLLFFAIGLGAATPMLWRLKRRFGTWAAPAVAVVLFAAAFLASSVVLGPLISGSDFANPAVTTTHGHEH
jgi:peptidoglycan/LPS O-acetylase OafA/YrhL